jgi:hypothetical protein
MKKSYTYEQLVEKIVRAKMNLSSCLMNHTESCPVDYDPYYYGPCKCGASRLNNAINHALEELKL